MKSLSAWRTVVLVTIALFLMAACAPAAQPPAAPEVEQEVSTKAPAEEAGEAPQVTFIMCVNNQPKNIDPHVGTSNPELEILTASYETLIAYEPGGYELKPALATDWQYNDDKTQLTLNIREGVTFHDGSELDAEVVKAGLERSMTIGQGESFFLDPVESIDVPDTYTVVINLKQPAPEFVLGLTR